MHSGLPTVTSKDQPALYGPNGELLPPARTRRRMGYMAGSTAHQDLASWVPFNPSAQTALGFNRDIVSARIHDIARNDGWASAAVERPVDNLIGAGWRLSAKPNARSLGIDEEAAQALADEIEAAYDDWASDPGLWGDVERRGTVGMTDALAVRHRMLDGESLAVIYWLERGGSYATCFQIIDPDRLSQPLGKYETETLRAGVEMDENGAPIAYHIRRHHPGEAILAGVNLFDWERVERETEWGRPIVVHAFERQRAGQVRGVSPLAPILKKLKQIGRYDEAELQAAVLNALLAAFIESPFDHDQAAEALAGQDLTAYQQARTAYWSETPLHIPGLQIGFTYPGEKVNFTSPGHPNSQYEAFERGALRNVASAAGLSYEQLTMDWSQVNYSSARAALLEVWRGMTARKNGFVAVHKQPIYAAWLEEAIETGQVKLPAGAPSFQDKRAAYCKAEWIGPGRGWVDPQKEADAAATRIDAGLSTLERECAEQGLDWKDVMAQQKREHDEARRLGLNAAAPLRATQSRDRPDTAPDTAAGQETD